MVAFANQLGGGASVLVSSDPTNPVPTGDVATLDGVKHVAVAPELSALLVSRGGAIGAQVTVVGVGTNLVGYGTPTIEGDSPTQSVAIFDAIIRDPSKVVVGADLEANAVSGLTTGTPRLGTPIDLRDPSSGVTRTVTVAALAAQAQFNGASHVYVADALLAQLVGRVPTTSLMYVTTGPSVNNEDLAAVIDGTHLANGTVARSFTTFARERLNSEETYLRILAGYAALALLATLIALSVVMTDRGRSRRQETATLRAIGFRGRTITAAFAIEAATVAAQGVVVGVVAGLLLAWRLVSGPTLPEHRFSVPWAMLVEIGVLTVLAALAVSALPAWRAGRETPRGSASPRRVMEEYCSSWTYLSEWVRLGLTSVNSRRDLMPSLAKTCRR